jgi:uncharacterized coiled-coil protein SlyX
MLDNEKPVEDITEDLCEDITEEDQKLFFCHYFLNSNMPLIGNPEIQEYIDALEYPPMLERLERGITEFPVDIEDVQFHLRRLVEKIEDLRLDVAWRILDNTHVLPPSLLNPESTKEKLFEKIDELKELLSFYQVLRMLELKIVSGCDPSKEVRRPKTISHALDTVFYPDKVD